MDILKQQDHIPNGTVYAVKKQCVGYFAAHGHEFFELEYILDGSGVYEIDGIAYPIRAGTVFLMTPAHVHTVRHANAELINVMFECEYKSEEFPLPLTDASAAPVFHLQSDDRTLTEALLSELIRVQEQSRTYAMLLLRCFLQKLTFCAHVTTACTSSYVRQAILYLLENFRSTIGLREVAAVVGLSKAYFSDLFAKQTGIGFKEYLDALRFSYACKLLTLTELTTVQICDRAGFSDYANFMRRFKMRYHLTPGDYRKQTRATSAATVTS